MIYALFQNNIYIQCNYNACNVPPDEGLQKRANFFTLFVGLAWTGDPLAGKAGSGDNPLSCVSTVVQIHRAARASSSGKQKVCLALLASELHVTFKSGKRRAALWICTTVETRL
jgi:hypothetical protein